MKAVQLVQVGKPLELREVPLPEPRPDEIRVKVLAAGICRSDAHYRAGTASVGALPLTLGHEIAGVVDAIGTAVDTLSVGDRVALHYLITCGRCDYCVRGLEQFCEHGRMVGKHVDGGYAEYVIAPAHNAIAVPATVSAAAAAIMMCSTATAFHALRKARLAPGDDVAIFGTGGLGMSAIQLARACGAGTVFAVDIDSAKLEAARRHGAQPVDAAQGDAVRQLQALTRGRGVDVALEFAGTSATQEQAVASLAVHGRAAMAGISAVPFAVQGFPTLINREAEIIGISDHLRSELRTLMDIARRGSLDLDGIIDDRIPLHADQINQRLDALAAFRGRTRSVILPHGEE